MAKRKRKSQKKRYLTVVRSAITGRFVKKGNAKKNPKTTVTERIPLRRKRKKRK